HQTAEHLAADESATIVHAPQSFVLVEALLEDTLAALQDAGAVDHHMGDAERTRDGLAQGFYRCLIADIGFDKAGSKRSSGRTVASDLRAACLVASGHYHARSFLSETQGYRASDPGRAADHENCLDISHCRDPCEQCRRTRTSPRPGNPSWGVRAGCGSRFPWPFAARPSRPAPC